MALPKKKPQKLTLPELGVQRQDILDKLEIARLELYKHTATSKLGEYEFELARADCLKYTNELRANETAITKAQKAL